MPLEYTMYFFGPAQIPGQFDLCFNKLENSVNKQEICHIKGSFRCHENNKNLNIYENLTKSCDYREIEVYLVRDAVSCGWS